MRVRACAPLSWEPLVIHFTSSSNSPPPLPRPQCPWTLAADGRSGAPAPGTHDPRAALVARAGGAGLLTERWGNSGSRLWACTLCGADGATAAAAAQDGRIALWRLPPPAA